MKRLILTLVTLTTLVAPAALAQDQYVELLRQDLRTEKVAVVTEAMMLTAEQSDAFWPIYREYDNELTGIWDERIALIKDYAANYQSMDDAKADEIATKAMKLGEKRLKLRSSYYKKMKKELGAVVAGRFWQVDGVIQNLVDLQVMAELPLVQSAAETTEGH